MQELVFAPMGLVAAYEPEIARSRPRLDLATLYRKRSPEGEVWNPEGPWIEQFDGAASDSVRPVDLSGYVPGTNATVFKPDGGLRISARGLAAIAEMLLARGSYRGARVIGPVSVDLMFAQQWRLDAKDANGDSMGGFIQQWGLGNQQFGFGQQGADDLVKGGGIHAVGHMGKAWGARSAIVLDRTHARAFVYLVGGSGCEPDLQPGAYSKMSSIDERLVAVLAGVWR